jgi:DNA-binding NtrC family response regulator
MKEIQKQFQELYKRMNYFEAEIQRLEARRDDAEFFLKHYDKFLAEAKNKFYATLEDLDALTEKENALLNENAQEEARAFSGYSQNEQI